MITAREYLNEIKLAMMRYQINAEFDDPALMSMINKARRQVQIATLYLFPEFYTDVIEVDFSDFTQTNVQYLNNATTYSYEMPDSFIEPIEVWVYYQNTADSDQLYYGNQIRIVSSREYDYTLRHSFNTAQTLTGVCYFDNRINTGKSTIFITLPNDYVNNVAQFNPIIRIYFFALVDDIEYITNVATGGLSVTKNSDVDVQMPPHIVDVIIQQALVYILSGLDKAFLIQRAKDELEISLALLKVGSSFERFQESFFLPSKQSLSEDEFSKAQSLQQNVK